VSQAESSEARNTYSDRGDVADFTGAGEQGLLIEGLLEVRTDHTAGVRAFRLDHAGIQRIDADLPRLYRRF
jgi:hypothetical protein